MSESIAKWVADCRECGKAVSRILPVGKGSAEPKRIRCKNCRKTNYIENTENP